MKKRKKKRVSYIPVDTLEEAEAVFGTAVHEGKITFPTFESTIPESVFTGCKTTLEKVEAVQEYLSKRQVTDEEFFQLIDDDPAYLCDNFAQEKIALWQSEVNSTDKDKASNAQDKLKEIGKVLAHKKPRKSPIPTFRIAEKRHNVYQQLKESGITKMRSTVNMRLTLKERFGQNILDDACLDHMIEAHSLRDDDLADLITAKLMNISASKVEKCRKKEVKKIKGHPIYLLRK